MLLTGVRGGSPPSTFLRREIDTYMAMKQQTLEQKTTWKKISNILTMKIYHAVPSLFKGFSCFTTSVNPKRPKITLRRSTRKKICLKWMTDTKSVKKKPAKTTENVARYVRRMDTYPVGV